MNQLEAQKLFLPLIEKDGSMFEKFQKIWARPAIVGEKIITITSDGKETENTAKEGDYVIQAQTDAQEKYIISETKLVQRYVIDSIIIGIFGWQEYIPTGTVKAIELHPNQLGLDNSFWFESPWNELTVAKKGDMICTTDGIEIYRIARKEFEQTYKIKT